MGEKARALIWCLFPSWDCCSTDSIGLSGGLLVAWNPLLYLLLLLGVSFNWVVLVNLIWISNSLTVMGLMWAVSCSSPTWHR